ncbi:hypothetical protein AB0M11_38100 [Streptomyces sp. NPDC051987]|uniref:hypothetical protein n=1 Tax=Streptomyces sp. NPDC051987 TaxID=3155808 RepID=UPI00343525C4
MAALRAADPGSRWFFHRREDGGALVVDVWFHSHDSVLTDTADRLRGREGGGSPSTWSFGSPPGVPAGAFSGSPAAEGLTVALASASSDLALAALRDGGLPEDTQRSLALLHLRTLAGLVPDAHRLGFLFLYWESRATELSPGERTRIAQLADRHVAEQVSEQSEDIWRGEHEETSWRDYVRATRALVPGDAGAAPPVNYLLFRHARETHARLGIPAATEAFAARAVRAALRAAPAVPVPELQSA